MKYRVTVDCCTSGNCNTCTGKSPTGKPLRVMHSDGLSKAMAEKIKKTWAAYHPVIEESDQPTAYGDLPNEPK